MKKLLSIFASLGLLAGVSSSVISCRVEKNVDEVLLKVDILVEDQNRNEFTTFNYQTDFETLGELMSAPENKHNYQLHDYGGDLGFALEAIIYEKDGENITLPEKPDPTIFWALYYINNQGEEISSDIGMSGFVFAERSTQIIWQLTKYQSFKILNYS